MYKSEGLFPVKLIEWNGKDQKWTISGIVGDTIKIRFINELVQKCPPRNGWIYLQDGEDEQADRQDSDIVVDIFQNNATDV